MTTLRFTKGHGTENDFVLLFDELGAIDLSAELVRFLCDRRAGIGADGVIRAVRAGHLAAGAGLPPQTWFMDYWNSDGTTSEMCGNGARVFAAFLAAEGGVASSGGQHGEVPGVEALEFATRGGPRSVWGLGDGHYAVDMGPWSTPGGVDCAVEVGGLEGARPGLSVDVGNPHRVIALASLDELELVDLSVAPAVEPVPSAGANIELAVPLGEDLVSGERRGLVTMRVRERGSGETRSCGTGACAVAIAVRNWAGDGAPDVWDIGVPGGRLTVRIEATRVVLEGPARLVASGNVTVPPAA